MPVADGSAGSSRGSRPPRHSSGHHFVRSSPPPPPRPPYNPPSPPSPSGQYGGGSTPSYGYSAPSRPSPQRSFRAPSGGGPAGQSKERAKPKPKPKPKPPSVGKYLKSDEQYQRDRAGLIKNFKNFKLTTGENKQNVLMDRGTTIERLKEEQAENLKEMQDDFAARGLFGGAEYLKKENDFNTDYLEQKTDTRQSASRNIQQLLRDLRNARTLKDENLSQARLEAIRRRAAEFGIKN